MAKGNKRNTKKNSTIIGLMDDIVSEDLKGEVMGDTTLSTDNEGDDVTMVKGQGKTEHNLIEMDEEVTVTIDGISDLFKTVEEDGTEDQEIIDELTPKDKDDKPAEEPELTAEGKAHSLRANLIGEAFSLIAQELVDKCKSGQELPGRKKIKKKVLARAAELAMKNEAYAKTITEGGGVKVFAEELEETFNYPTILDKYEKLIDHLIYMSKGIADGTIKTPADEPKIPAAPKADETPEEPVVTTEPVAPPVGDEPKADDALLFFNKPEDKEEPSTEVTSTILENLDTLVSLGATVTELITKHPELASKKEELVKALATKMLKGLEGTLLETVAEVTGTQIEEKKPYKTMREQMLEAWEKEKAEKAAKETTKADDPKPKTEPVKPKKKEEVISTQAQYIFASKKPSCIYA